MINSPPKRRSHKIITKTSKLIKTIYQRYIKTYARARLAASSGPRTKGVPTNNQRERR